jgi:hypothetical protein
MKLFLKIFIALIFIILFIVLGGKILSINKPIATNQLIVEGWIPFYVLELDENRRIFDSYKEIYFSGLSGTFDTLAIQGRRDCAMRCRKQLYSNGAIYLSKNGLLKIPDHQVIKKISIYSHCDFAFYRNAHFFVSLGDSLIGQTFSTPRTQALEISGTFTARELNFFTLYYGNDLEYDGIDRNLYIDSVMFDTISLVQENDFMAMEDFTIPACQRNFPFRSNAAFLQAYIEVLGVKNNTVVIDTLFCNRNKTFAQAKKVFIELKSKSLQSEKYNILSFGLHARRSYKVYRSFFPKENIGIIDLQDINSPTSSYQKEVEYLATMLDEYASIIGNYFY